MSPAVRWCAVPITRTSSRRFCSAALARSLLEGVAMDEQVSREAEAQNSNREADDNDEGLECFGPGFDFGRFFALGFPQSRHFVLQCTSDGLLVFEFKRQPVALEQSPGFRLAL